MKPIAVCAVLAGALLATPALADTPPKRAAGLWETATITNAGRSGARECVDARTDRLVRQATAGLTCRNDDFKRTADGWSAGAKCSSGGMSTDTLVTVTGDFETFARARAVTEMTGLSGDGGTRSFSTTIEARRIGDCEPGQTPGDIILPNGQIIHVEGAGR